METIRQVYDYLRAYNINIPIDDIWWGKTFEYGVHLAIKIEGDFENVISLMKDVNFELLFKRTATDTPIGNFTILYFRENNC
jgi:hypothetical protein